MQIHLIVWLRFLSLSVKVCLATIGVAFFGALTSVGALFYFMEEKKMKTKLKQTLAIIIALTLTVCTLSACGANNEKSILGKWYNANGDCLEIQSDNTYRTDFVEEKGKTIGSGSGKWMYLEEENLFKFYSNDDRIWEITISKDKYGESFEYSYYGIFYKNEFPLEVIEEMEREKEEQYLESTVVCPNFVGKSYEEIINNKEYKENFVFEVKWDVNDEHEYGIVFNQSVTAGEKLKKNAKITLFVSKSGDRREIPDVYGMEETAAITELEIHGFIVEETVDIPNVDIEKGKVVRTEPPRTSVQFPGTKVKVYVSSGAPSKETTVSDVTKMTSDDAVDLLEGEGFIVDVEKVKLSIKESYVKVGLVYKQSVEPETAVEEGSTIKIYVCDGYTFDVEFELPSDIAEGQYTVSLWKNGEKFSNVSDVTLDSKEKKSGVLKGAAATEDQLEVTVKIKDKDGKSYDLSKYKIDRKNETVSKRVSKVEDYKKYPKRIPT